MFSVQAGTPLEVYIGFQPDTKDSTRNKTRKSGRTAILCTGIMHAKRTHRWISSGTDAKSQLFHTPRNRNHLKDGSFKTSSISVQICSTFSSNARSHGSQDFNFSSISCAFFMSSFKSEAGRRSSSGGLRREAEQMVRPSSQFLYRLQDSRILWPGQLWSCTTDAPGCPCFCWGHKSSTHCGATHGGIPAFLSLLLTRLPWPGKGLKPSPRSTEASYPSLMLLWIAWEHKSCRPSKISCAKVKQCVNLTRFLQRTHRYIASGWHTAISKQPSNNGTKILLMVVKKPCPCLCTSGTDWGHFSTSLFPSTQANHALAIFCVAIPRRNGWCCLDTDPMIQDFIRDSPGRAPNLFINLSNSVCIHQKTGAVMKCSNAGTTGTTKVTYCCWSQEARSSFFSRTYRPNSSLWNHRMTMPPTEGHNIMSSFSTRHATR